MMKKPTWTVECSLYLTAFLLAAAVRLIGLGQETLSDLEAGLALQALASSRGALTSLSPQPFYVLWTGFTFFLLEAGSGLARLLPALAGCGLILAPYLYRKIIGRSPALLLAFGLALSPVLTSTSRQADGVMISLSFAILALGFLLNRRPAFAGILAGLALLGGPAIWMILLTLAFVVLWGWTISLRGQNRTKAEGESTPIWFPFLRELPWRETVPWLVGSALFAGTLFFTRFSGLSAAASSLVAFFSGWTSPSRVSFAQFFFALVTSETFALVLGGWALLRGWLQRDALDMFLGRLFVVALVLMLIYPAHRMTDASLVVIPLWGLTSRQIARWFQNFPEERLPSFALTAVIFALFVFGWMNIAGTPTAQELGGETQIRWLSFAAAVIISLLMSVLVAWGWSPAVGGYGLRTAVTATLGLFLIFNLWSATGLGRLPAANPWRSAPYHQDADLLVKTIDQFSMWNSKNRLAMDVFVVGVDSAGLKWLLRDRESVQYMDSLPLEETPPLLITPVQASPPDSAAYTGQDFVWLQSPAWALMLPLEWMQWALYREAPLEREAVILWVRSDLFAGAQAEPAAE
ncbi:MAG: hypothetical protein IT308_04895 [Anaerolineaceae bacterium]|nr:hypothetical protein [Anaerolineaceae bacterium]